MSGIQQNVSAWTRASKTADRNGSARPSAANEHRSSAEPAHARIRLRVPQRVERHVAADEVARVPLRDVESRPSVTATDFQEAAAGAVILQEVAEGLRLRNGREAVQADGVSEDRALDPPRDLASRLGILLSESIDRDPVRPRFR